MIRVETGGVTAGLAYRCVAAATLDAEAAELAARLAAGPTRALGLTERLLNGAFESDLASSLELEGHFQALATASADLPEGPAAARQRRPPGFRGR